MKAFIIFAAVILSQNSIAQNVGIGTTTPAFPLSFGPTTGDKISLWSNSTNSYGFGIQSSLLQVHTDISAADIAFGYGSSSAFTQRMRLINAGGDGMQLSGRITLNNGTVPLDINYGPGVWLTKADNSTLLGFMGTQNNQNVGFYGGPAGWGFTYDAINSLVGIGNNTPDAPLSFSASLGKKITLYPGATGNAGFAVSGNRLQIYADNPNADVALGYDAAGTFNERFAVKANGALAVNSNTGNAGQVLQSNGASSSPVWVDPTKAFTSNSAGFSPMVNDGDETAISQITITLTQASNVEVSGTVGMYSAGCFGCSDASVYLILTDPLHTNGTVVAANSHVISVTTMGFVYNTSFLAGTYLISLKARKVNGPAVESAFFHISTYESPAGFITAKIIPE